MNKEFPIKLGYWIGRFFDKVQQESKVYFKEKEKLIKKYAKRDEDGKIVEDEKTKEVKFDDKEKETFDEALIELQQIKCPIDVKRIEIDLEDLEAKGVKLKPIEFSFLDPLFITEENGKEPSKKKGKKKDKKGKKKK